MIYLFLFLHLIALPFAIIAALAEGVFALAIVDGIAFLLLFAVWALYRKP